jgi:hypothetical protein
MPAARLVYGNEYLCVFLKIGIANDEFPGPNMAILRYFVTVAFPTQAVSFTKDELDMFSSYSEIGLMTCVSKIYIYVLTSSPKKCIN